MLYKVPFYLSWVENFMSNEQNSEANETKSWKLDFVYCVSYLI
jgi:hypothetical protein